MKKIISFLLLAAMLVGCFSSAVIVSAADVTLTAESVEKIQGTGTELALALSIENNPGISTMSVVVYYDKAQLAQGSSDAFEGALASASDSAVNGEVVGTNNKVKNYIPADARSASKAFVVDLCGAYNEETEATDTIVGDGVLVYIPLNIISEEVGSFNYNVVVAEAYDENGDEIEIAEVAGTVTYAADPLIGIYDDFTVFTNTAETDVVIGTKEVSVDIRLDQNPGIWCALLYIVYPAGLSLENASGEVDVTNHTSIFTNSSDLLPGDPDVALDSDKQPAAFKKYLAANPELLKDGYRSSIVYFEKPETDGSNYSNNGVLCTLNFKIADDVVAGDVLDITLHTTSASFITVDANGESTEFFPALIGTDLTIVEKVCEHATTSTTHQDATCGADGFDKVVCDECGATISENVIPATGEHVEGAPEITDSTCSVAGKEVYNCSVCGEFIREVALGLANHTPGADATCQSAQTCTECGTELAAKLDHVEGEAVRTNPTCDEDGKDVYNCASCGTFMREEVIEATGHSYLSTQGGTIVPPTCTEDGYTIKNCDNCGEPKVTDPSPAWGHDEDGEVVTVEATCLTEGSITIYCATCGEISKEEVIPVSTTHNLEYVAAVEAGCHQTGNVEYWYCVDCDAVYTDAEGKYLSNRKNVTIPALNELAYVPAAEACHVAGTQEYWFCPECDAVFADAAATILTNRKNLTIEADCELVHMDAVEACHANGTYEYWFCPECDAVFADAEGTQRTNRMNLTIPADAEAKHVAKVDATCTANGTLEYWYCEECDTFFADAECKYNVAYLSLTIPATGHDYKDGACTVCGDKDEEKKPENDKAPVTGDNMMFIVIALAVVLVAGAAIVLFRRKRSAN